MLGIETLEALPYDYFIKDHLGNVRMTLTEEAKQDVYPTLSLEGTSGTQPVTDQNKTWEKADGTNFDVATRRTTSPGTFRLCRCSQSLRSQCSHRETPRQVFFTCLTKTSEAKNYNSHQRKLIL